MNFQFSKFNLHSAHAKTSKKDDDEIDASAVTAVVNQ